MLSLRLSGEINNDVPTYNGTEVGTLFLPPAAAAAPLVPHPGDAGSRVYTSFSQAFPVFLSLSTDLARFPRRREGSPWCSSFNCKRAGNYDFQCRWGKLAGAWEIFRAESASGDGCDVADARRRRWLRFCGNGAGWRVREVGILGLIVMVSE